MIQINFNDQKYIMRDYFQSNFIFAMIHPNNQQQQTLMRQKGPKGKSDDCLSQVSNSTNRESYFNQGDYETIEQQKLLSKVAYDQLVNQQLRYRGIDQNNIFYRSKLPPCCQKSLMLHQIFYNKPDNLILMDMQFPPPQSQIQDLFIAHAALTNNNVSGCIMIGMIETLLKKNRMTSGFLFKNDDQKEELQIFLMNQFIKRYGKDNINVAIQFVPITYNPNITENFKSYIKRHSKKHQVSQILKEQTIIVSPYIPNAYAIKIRVFPRKEMLILKKNGQQFVPILIKGNIEIKYPGQDLLKYYKRRLQRKQFGEGHHICQRYENMVHIVDQQSSDDFIKKWNRKQKKIRQILKLNDSRYIDRLLNEQKIIQLFNEFEWKNQISILDKSTIQYPGMVEQRFRILIKREVNDPRSCHLQLLLQQHIEAYYQGVQRELVISNTTQNSLQYPVLICKFQINLKGHNYWTQQYGTSDLSSAHFLPIQ